MEQIATLLSHCPAEAIPLVIVILGLFWIHRKTENIERARKTTKAERDKDSQEVHDDILKLKFDIASMKGVVDLHRETLQDLQKQVAIVVNELTELNCNMRHLLEEKNKG